MSEDRHKYGGYWNNLSERRQWPGPQWEQQGWRDGALSRHILKAESVRPTDGMGVGCKKSTMVFGA